MISTIFNFLVFYCIQYFYCGPNGAISKALNCRVNGMGLILGSGDLSSYIYIYIDLHID